MLSRRTLLQSAAGVSFTPRLAAEIQSRAYAADTVGRDLTRPQLFLDDTWVEETYRLQRVWERADVFPEPVLRPEAPWEGRQIIMFGSVFQHGSEWRMYYLTYNPPEPSRMCLAFSSDGIRWERPKLGLFEFRGSKANNIVFAPDPGDRHDGPTVCYDPDDAAAPYKMIFFLYEDSTKPPGEYVSFSKDGIQWRTPSGPVMMTGDRTNIMSGRDHRGKFVAFLRHKDMLKIHHARSIWRSESDDFIRWTAPEVVLREDMLDDVNTELYGMPVFRYSDIYLGMLERWRGNPDVIDVQLAWSYDGKDWRRPAQRSVFLGPQHSWNRRWNTCASTPPVRTWNVLNFYFGGRSGAHESPESYGAVGLATIRADRFAAITGDFKPGILLTRPMTWPGGELVLNSTNTRNPGGHPSAGGGSVLVEVRDENNRGIAGFSGDDAAVHDVQSPSARGRDDRGVRWRNSKFMKELAGRRIRLAITLRDARLYSFRAQA